MASVEAAGALACRAASLIDCCLFFQFVVFCLHAMIDRMFCVASARLFVMSGLNRSPRAKELLRRRRSRPYFSS